MKKKISLIFMFLLMFLGLTKVNAYTYTLTSSSTTVTVGSTVRVTLNTNDVMGFYKITSSNPSVLAGNDGDSIENGNAYSKSFTFSAKSAGTATITVSPTSAGLNVYSTEEPLYTRSITINVVNKTTPSKIDVNKTYNKNNYLKSLSLDGYTLSPEFNKDTLEYSVTLEPGTESIVVNASQEESTSSIKGAGEISVSEGINTINVVVTAENGNERTYIIKASVEEKDPIEIKINNETYRVVKKENLIPDKEGYNKITVNINNFDIPALYNEVTKVTLVGLKDKEGSILLYSYDSRTGEYSEYQELKFDIMNLYVHEKKNSKYKKITIKINGIDVPAYKLDNIDDYYLLYATNTSTGYEGYYLYDKKENSAQRYDTTLLESLTKEKDKYLAIVIVLSSVCFLSMLFLLIEVNRDNKRKNEE